MKTEAIIWSITPDYFRWFIKLYPFELWYGASPMYPSYSEMNLSDDLIIEKKRETVHLNIVWAIFSGRGIYKPNTIRLLLPCKLNRLNVPSILRLAVDWGLLFVLKQIMQSYRGWWVFLIEPIVVEITILTFILVVKRYLPLHRWHLQLSPRSIWAHDNFRMVHILIFVNV